MALLTKSEIEGALLSGETVTWEDNGGLKQSLALGEAPESNK